MAETMHEYLFDVKFFSSIRVKGTNEKEARQNLDTILAQASLELGNVDGQPARAAVSPDGEHDLLEIDGEDAE